MTHLQGLSHQDCVCASLACCIAQLLQAGTASDIAERPKSSGSSGSGHMVMTDDEKMCKAAAKVSLSNPLANVLLTHTHTRIHHCLSPSFSLSPSRVFSLALADTQRVTGRHEVPGDTSRPRSRCQCHGLRQAQVFTPTHTPPFAVYSTALLCADLI